MKTTLPIALLAGILLLMPNLNFAQTAPTLSTLTDFALFTSAGAFNNSGATLITGDVGSFTDNVVGLEAGQVNGTIYVVGDPVLLAAKEEAELVYSFLQTTSGAGLIGAGLGGQSLTPGVYTTGSGAAANLVGVLTLDALWNPDAVFIIKIDGALTTGSGASVLLANGAKWENVYWQINGAVTMVTGVDFVGNIFANGAIEMLEEASLQGRGVSIAGAISLSNNSVSSAVSDPIVSDPSIVLKKTANNTNNVQVDDEVTYYYEVTNNGNVPLENIQLTDDHPGTGVLGDFIPNPSNVVELSPGASVVFTATYVVTQQDIDNLETITNLATASAEYDGNSVEATDDETINLLMQDPLLTLDKTASPSSFEAVGDLITYTIVVRNTSDVDITEITVEDSMIGLDDSIPLLMPGQFASFTQTYLTTQADMDFGSVVNIARATGLDPANNTVTAEGLSHIRTVQNPAINISKTASPSTFGYAGDQITYTIEVSNPGNVTVHSIDVQDPLTGLYEHILSLGPGETQTFFATYVITTEDVDAGVVINVAYAAGGSWYCFFRVNDSDEAMVVIDRTLGLSVVKSASPEVYSMVGEPITYSIEVTNTGSVTVSNIVVEDPLTGLDETIETLLSGQSRAFTEIYLVTQEDLDAGSIRNTASARGYGPGPSLVQGLGVAVVLAEQNPELSISKTSQQSSFSFAGEQISYTITITNSGNVTISDLLVEDPLTGLLQEIESLAPEQSLSFNETYIVSQENLDSGELLNQALVSGFDPNNSPVSGSADRLIPAGQNSELSVTKTAEPETFSAPGDQIAYTIVVSNTGNVTLSDVYVEDPLTGLGFLIGEMAPGSTRSFSESYVILLADVHEGKVVNVATATGKDPDQEEVIASGEAIIEAISVELDITKNAGSSQVYVGDQATYTIVVSNNNQSTAINVVLTDELPMGVSFVSASAGGTYHAGTNTVTWSLGDLAAGLSFTVSLVVEVRSDIATGTVITNFAVVNNDNAEFPAESNRAAVTAIALADLMITKGADVGSAYNGELITYTLTVSNLGPSVAASVVVQDMLPPQVEFVSASHDGSFSAGNNQVTWALGNMSNQASFTLTLVVRVKADVPAATTITNFASVTSQTVDPNLENNEASVSVTGSGPQADVQVVKVIEGGIAYAGQNHTYSITVSNNGPSAATNIEVEDVIPAQTSFVSAGQNGNYNAGTRSVTWSIASLAPGQSQDFTLTVYVPSDIAGGTILVNEVRANSNIHDPNPANNTYILQTPVTTPELFIPDVFSPNLDGINDRWIIRGLDAYPNNKVVIINRWGNRVFEASPYNNDWDGTNQFSPMVGGNELPVGTYFYILDLGNNDVRRGFIYLTR
jgi:gliding motility-associated-like protein/uncharacterized repeat protein (TIGR01451 family)